MDNHSKVLDSIKKKEKILSKQDLKGTPFKLVDYLHTRSHIFAQALHLMTGWEIGTLDDEEAPSEYGDFNWPKIMHFYVIHPSGRKVDIRGFISDLDITSMFELNEPATYLFDYKHIENIYNCSHIDRPLPNEIFAMQKYIKEKLL